MSDPSGTTGAERLQEFDDVALLLAPGSNLRPDEPRPSTFVPKPADAHPLWRALRERFDHATPCAERVAVLTEFYAALVANVKILAVGAKAESRPTVPATELAMRIGQVLARNQAFRTAFERLVGGIELHAAQAGRVYDVVGNVVHLYSTNATLTDDDVVALTIRILARRLCILMRRALREQYRLWFSQEGAVVAGAAHPEDEVACLAVIACLQRRREREELRRKHGVSFEERYQWVLKMLADNGLCGS
ncbi:MAG: hypothetical protein HYS13_23905 [Planctomycetia bacterium]|nr:hypothetical protein [Planctomycetia bacterium]